MFTVMEGSKDNVMGMAFEGTIHKEDYAQFVPKIEEMVKQYGDVRLLCDLGDFKSEALDAFAADFKFGREFHDKIVKMAIVGDKRWEAWIAKLAAPFYAKEAKYFHVADMDAAWAWLKA